MGAEFASVVITLSTKENLSQLLYPKEIFEQMADASWGVEKTQVSADKTHNKTAFSFTKQMAALYNKSAYSGKDLVLEMCYTDCKERYQIVITKNGSKVLADNFLPYTTKIETPFTVWQDIAKGTINEQAAMMEKLYRVDGDFNLIIKWTNYFGAAVSSNERKYT